MGQVGSFIGRNVQSIGEQFPAIRFPRNGGVEFNWNSKVNDDSTSIRLFGRSAPGRLAPGRSAPFVFSINSFKGRYKDNVDCFKGNTSQRYHNRYHSSQRSSPSQACEIVRSSTKLDTVAPPTSKIIVKKAVTRPSVGAKSTEKKNLRTKANTTKSAQKRRATGTPTETPASKKSRVSP